MKKNNTLPERWYIEDEYDEVREYLAQKEPKVIGWDKEWRWIGVDGNGSINGGINAWKDESDIRIRRGIVKITIEEFREMVKSAPKIINNYEIY